jgi:putative hydrolase of the HAD superfamily
MNPKFVPPNSRAIFFDAVGTLITPCPSAVDVYHEAGKRYGLALDRATIAERFQKRFRQEEEHDRAADWRVDESRERQRWWNIVQGVFAELHQPAQLFEDLWSHFARPEAWRLADGLDAVFTNALQSGLVLGVASNFDRRLHQILDGHCQFRGVTHRIISSETGWRKPALRFFQRVIESAQCRPDEMIFVGDQPETDAEGAHLAGMRAILLMPEGSPPRSIPTIHQLTELL